MSGYLDRSLDVARGENIPCERAQICIIAILHSEQERGSWLCSLCVPAPCISGISRPFSNWATAHYIGMLLGKGFLAVVLGRLVYNKWLYFRNSLEFVFPLLNLRSVIRISGGIFLCALSTYVGFISQSLPLKNLVSISRHGFLSFHQICCPFGIPKTIRPSWCSRL